MNVHPEIAGRWSAPDAATMERFTAIVGARYALTTQSEIAPFLAEPRELYHGRAAMVLRPGTTAEVAAIMALASAGRIPVVPQGGNTGLVGGQVPFSGGAEIVVSLTRLAAIREVDPSTNAMIAEAGVTLDAIQKAAAAVDRLFPLSLGSEGSCQIGGNLSTNAGGTAVLAYGNARDLALGLEVVLADGRVLNGLKRLRKDNTGYDLKDLFIGAEGTLGIITAASLKLFARPRAVATAFVALPDVEAGVALLRRLQASAGGTVTSCELLPRIGLDMVLRHRADARDPLATRADWYVLVELSGAGDEAALTASLEDALANAAGDGLLIDAALARSLAQGADFWRLRHFVVEVQRDEGGSIKHDVAVPVARVADFIRSATAAALSVVPDARPIPFGHIGDGNIHFNVSQPVGMAREAYLARWDDMAAAVHAVVRDMGGSISAEHGIGRMKRDELAATADPVALDIMRTLKRALDPAGILNPGKVL